MTSITAIPPIGAATTGGTSDKPAGSAALMDPSTSQDVFLKLLVAQIQNQNPLQPMDGMQFVTQLTQFSQLEQLLAIHADFDSLVGAAKTGQNSGSTGSTAPTS